MSKTRQVSLLLAETAFVALVGGSIWASNKIAIWDSAKKMWPDPWFKLTMLDLYLGFSLVGLFIAHRERRVVRTGIWALLLAGLGNIATFLYLIIALIETRKNTPFWRPKHEKWSWF